MLPQKPNPPSFRAVVWSDGQRQWTGKWRDTLETATDDFPSFALFGRKELRIEKVIDYAFIGTMIFSDGETSA